MEEHLEPLILPHRLRLLVQTHHLEGEVAVVTVSGDREVGIWVGHQALCG